MTRSQFFLGALLLSSACISRGGGPVDPPPADAGTDITSPPTDARTGDSSTPRDRPMCSTTMAREDSARECADGLDNDCNGFADCDDFNCRTCAVPACLTGNAVQLRNDGGTCMCMSTAENTLAQCSDGIDNDCDGFTDCQDFSCVNCSVSVCLSDGGIQRGDAGFCTCRGPEDNNAACGDMQDNDCNGFIDCNDFSCSRSDGGVVTVCGSGDAGRADSGRADVAGCDASSTIEGTAAACTDGVDNDCNGFMDCNDRNCSCLGSCPATRSGCTCMAGGETTNAACMDGMDNDCDGFMDCADFNCTRNPAVTVCPTDGGTATDAARD